jgi:RND family efflux transporter MFP subunit
MAGRSLYQLLRHLRRVAAPGAGVLTDADLLARFADGRDEAAFEALVWRHGPLVFGVCRRVLGHTQDAEDAFQASFLILARKAGTVRRRAAIGPWLYRVAERVALRSRGRVRPAAPLPDELAGRNLPDTAECSELRRILTDEVMRLPSRYRLAVVLHYLEGRTTAEAAVALGCPPGTVLSRLAWARRRLRTRLAARGAALSAALAAAAADEAAGAVPARWVTGTVGAAAAFAAGGRAGRPALLAAEVLRAMLMTRLRVGAVVVFGALAAGTGLLLPGTSPGRADKPDQAAPPPVEVTVTKPTRRMTGEFQDFEGRTEASATVDIRSRITGQIERVTFQAGARVKRGDVLFELDGRAYQVEYERAKAEIHKAEGQLEQVKAELDRITRLSQVAGAASEELSRARAHVNEAQAGVLITRAGLERAKLDLDATRIASPIDGQTGGTVLGVGNLAAPTATLVTVVAMDPIYVDFLVPEADLSRLRKMHQPPDSAEVTFKGGNGETRRAKIIFVDNRVNPNGSVRFRAALPNPKSEILPGMFATVRLMIGERREELLVPQTAVHLDRATNQNFVLVAGGNNAIEWRPVTIGQLVGHDYVVSAGLGSDDRIVTTSLDDIKPGALLRIREEKAAK